MKKDDHSEKKEQIEEPKIQRRVHFVLQGKGGVGKSVVSTLYAQYEIQKFPGAVKCIDTDPINPTFSKFKSLSVERLEILERPNKINERVFDSLMEQILEGKEHFIIDNGSSGFVAISNYIVENDIPAVLEELEVFVHIPITGGQAFKETARGLVSISNQFNESTKIVPWVNEYFGPTEKPLKEYPFYKKVEDRISQIVTIPAVQNEDTLGQDLKDMFTNHMTFEDFANSDAKFMEKRRIQIFKDKMFAQLKELGF